jgi:hypothetical protein
MIDYVAVGFLRDSGVKTDYSRQTYEIVQGILNVLEEKEFNSLNEAQGTIMNIFLNIAPDVYELIYEKQITTNEIRDCVAKKIK